MLTLWIGREHIDGKTKVVENREVLSGHSVLLMSCDCWKEGSSVCQAVPFSRKSIEGMKCSKEAIHSW